MTLEKVLYTGNAHTTGGRHGASGSADGRLPLILPNLNLPLDLRQLKLGDRLIGDRTRA